MIISKEPLTVCFRNFFRNKMVNLSAKSVKHFLPNANIHCVSLYKNHSSEYDTQEPLADYISQRFYPTKYVSNKTIHDHIDSTQTSGYGNPDNGIYFCEGLNYIYDVFFKHNRKLLCLAEDHFFTTGATLKEIVEQDYDVAYASCEEVFGDIRFANAAILCFNPSRFSHSFPLPEVRDGQNVEVQLGLFLIDKIPPARRYILKNRLWNHTPSATTYVPGWPDYCGDGRYTNSSEEILHDLKEAGIV